MVMSPPLTFSAALFITLINVLLIARPGHGTLIEKHVPRQLSLERNLQIPRHVLDGWEPVDANSQIPDPAIDFFCLPGWKSTIDPLFCE